MLIEKPLAPNANEARDLHTAARDAQVVLQVGHVERFNPALQAAQSITQSPKFIDAIRCGGFTGRSRDVGVVLDLMIHDLDLILSMNDSPVEHVDAVGVAVLGEHEDLANARLTFADGCVANVSASRISPQPTRRMQVFSKSGFARLDFAGRCATVIHPSELLASGRFNLHEIPPGDQAQAVSSALTEESITPPPVDQLTEELSEFAACVQSGGTPRCGGPEACRAIEVAEMVLSGIAQHRWDDEPAPAPAILRGPHWDRVAAPAERREAS